MKSIIFALLVAAVAANPIFQSEDFGEEFAPKVEDWQMVPDTNGFLHLVDINSVDLDNEPAFNAPTDVIFHLFTRQNPTAPQNVALRNNAQLTASNFVGSRQTRFYTHGWGSANQNTGAVVRNAFIQHFDCNFFLVNWNAGSDTPNYILARQRVNPVAEAIADYILWLNSQHGLSLANTVTIGHSLGGHVAGVAGKRTRSTGLIQAVVGLCPAGPLFSLDDPANRIDHSDAQYVEVILTDAGRLGMNHPVGDANYFVNWGTSQPGCGIDLAGSCGHGRAVDIYAASINNANHFGATRCANHQAIGNRNCPAAGPSGRMGGEPVNNSLVAPSFVVSLYSFAHGEEELDKTPRYPPRPPGHTEQAGGHWQPSPSSRQDMEQSRVSPSANSTQARSYGAPQVYNEPHGDRGSRGDSSVSYANAAAPSANGRRLPPDHQAVPTAPQGYPGNFASASSPYGTTNQAMPYVSREQGQSRVPSHAPVLPSPGPGSQSYAAPAVSTKVVADDDEVDTAEPEFTLEYDDED